MIDARELRIWNLVLHKGKIERTESIYTWKGEYNYSEVDPIELTEARKEYFMEVFNIRVRSGVYSIYKHIGETFGYLCQLKYLHQLQNLYYCLTGKELEIQLTLKAV